MARVFSTVGESLLALRVDWYIRIDLPLTMQKQPTLPFCIDLGEGCGVLNSHRANAGSKGRLVHKLRLASGNAETIYWSALIQ